MRILRGPNSEFYVEGFQHYCSMTEQSAYVPGWRSKVISHFAYSCTREPLQKAITVLLRYLLQALEMLMIPQTLTPETLNLEP